VSPAGRASTEIFGPLAGNYAAARPGYPTALFDHLWDRLPNLPPRAADVAAGTGAATSGLLARGARVVALEPSADMLAKARSRLSGEPGWLGATRARAEALPLIDASLDLVVVAQAFHWFDARLALAECARVLRPGGWLALVWNITDPTPFTRDVRDLVRLYSPRHGRPVTEAMRQTPPALAEHPAFDVEPPIEFAHARRMDAERYVAYAASWSYCGGALEPDRWRGFERDLRALIAERHDERPWEDRMLATLHAARLRPA